MNKQEFKKAITKNLNGALKSSLDWKGYKNSKQPNKSRSAYFAFQVGEKVNELIEQRFPRKQINWRQIKFAEKRNKRIPGEWLLDGLWCAEVQPDCNSKSMHPSKIYAALECESSTSGKHFFEDFAKLVHVQSGIKIFLAGVDQVKEPKMNDYIAKRKRDAAKFLKNCARDLDTQEWYLAFWPSPKENIWKDLLKEKHPHLKNVNVFELKDREFVAI